jgi:hypothetical protein
LANQTENAAEVIGKDGRSKPSTIDEPCGQENVFLISDLLSTVWIIHRNIFGIRISLALVDLEQFVGNVLKGGGSEPR